MDSTHKEVFVSVDVETAGPSPDEYSLLSIGAVFVHDPAKQFYVELQPVSVAYTSEAREISGLDLEKLGATGLPPKEAMQQFADWVAANVSSGETPVFVAFNAPFDWMFVAFYFNRQLGRNPFGHKALDVKAYYMGQYHTTWARTSFEYVSRRFGGNITLPHNALGDAVVQADIFRAMLAEQDQRPERNEP